MRLRTIVVAALAAGCSGGQVAHGALQPHPPGTTVPAPLTTTTTTSPAPPKVRTAALTTFRSCGALLHAVRAEASAEVTPYGFQQTVYSPVGGGPMRAMTNASGAAASASAPEAAPAATGSAAGSSPGSPTGSFSATNNQEAGVDELDTTKTDGHLLVALTGSELRVTDVSSPTPRQRGSIVAGQQPIGLFRVGSTAVVIGYQNNQPTPTTLLSVFSLADPDHPIQIRSFSITGSEVAARLIGNTIKLVVSSNPTIVFPTPGPEPAANLAANRAAIASAPLDVWLPTVTDGLGRSQVASCTSVAYPPQRSGIGTVSVISIDPSQDRAGAPVSVLGTPGVVYASTTDLYVATSSFDQEQATIDGRPSPNGTTLVHDFDITHATAVYRGSGAVLGQPLNQYALSEYNGDLRVATTTGIPEPPPFEGSPVPPADGSQSVVTVLRPSHGALVPVGRLAGLGRTQRIYGVRFVGPLGYVVTFRQMDPLYIVDLSNPTAPALKGALELTGYSAYMHPLDASRLLGVGASADQNGHRLGLQVSLFDVSSPAHPAILAQSKLDGAYAQVENDPHAFLWWAPTGLVVLPVQGSAAVYHIGSSSLMPAGGLTAPGQITRVFVVDNRLVSETDQGVLVSDLYTLATEAWLPYS